MCSVSVIKKFYAKVDPLRGDPVHNFLTFYANLPLCVPSVRADFGCEGTKDVAAKREHTHTDRQTDNLSFIYECNTDHRVRCRSALCSLVFVLFFLSCLFGSSLECPARRLPRKTGWRHLPLKGNCQLSILQSGYSTFG